VVQFGSPHDVSGTYGLDKVTCRAVTVNPSPDLSASAVRNIVRILEIIGEL